MMSLLTRLRLWVCLFMIGSAQLSCESREGANEPDECLDRCVAPASCVEGRCVFVADQAIKPDATLSDTEPDQELDQGPGLSCAVEGERRVCPEALTPDELLSCSTRSQRCERGMWSACAPDLERCDEIDNDCDGLTDEGFTVGESCVVGLGLCARSGVKVCGAQGNVVRCEVESEEPTEPTHEPTRELCNALDDDCDGRVDEDVRLLGDSCSVGLGLCEQRGIYICDGEASEVVCNVSPLDPDEERCDGLDNDCDGSLDEEDARAGEACLTESLGVCREGVSACDPRGEIICVSLEAASEERCDGLDNDCDGLIDESPIILGEPCDSSLSGVCRAGVWACNAELDWACEPLTAPVEERCDAIDNDCDGAVDESDPELGALCQSGELGRCATGTRYCIGGELRCDSIYDPIPEICDGIDSDCDGFFDEETLAVGQPCQTGELGVCAVGVSGCEVGEVLCQRSRSPSVERCDGLDNDCDGQADEDFEGLGDDCEVNVASCVLPGRISCATPSTTTCESIEEPLEFELCDGIDNDCDGVTDELNADQSPHEELRHCGVCDQACVIPHAQATCEGGVCALASCHRGWVDADGALENGCERPCAPPRGEASGAERCDGLDNDCDGAVDESVSCVGDLINLCRDREVAGVTDAICHTFTPGEGEGEDDSGGEGGDQRRGALQFFPSDMLGPHETDLETRRALRPTLDHVMGGVERRTPRVGPSFELTAIVAINREPLRLGLYQIPSAHLIGEEEAKRQATGYVLTLSPTLEDGAPEVTLSRLEDEVELWRGVALDLAEGRRAVITWRRDALGRFEVLSDGVALTPMNRGDDDQSGDQPGADPLIDLTTLQTHRLGVRIGAYLEGPLSAYPPTEVDALTFRYDADGDLVYPPHDNCPEIYNPDQRDDDDNGIGVVCDDRDGDGIENSRDSCPLVTNPHQLDRDGDGVGDVCEFEQSLLMQMTYNGTAIEWVFNPQMGGHTPSELPREPGMTARASNGVEWAYVQNEVLYLISADDETREGQVVDLAVDVAFTEAGLVYIDVSRARVFFIPRANFFTDEFPTLVYEAQSGSSLSFAYSGERAEVFTLIERSERGALTVQSMSSLGDALTPPLPIHSAYEGRVPYVAKHRDRPLYLVSAERGAAQGVSLLYQDTGVLEQLSEIPTRSALFAGADRGFMSYRADERGGAVYLHADYRAPEEDVTPLIAPSPQLDSDFFIPVPHATPHPDVDHDGLEDALDLCPGRSRASAVMVHPLEGIEGSRSVARVIWSGEDLIVNIENDLYRYTLDGERLAEVTYAPEIRYSQMSTSATWVKGRYWLPHLRYADDFGNYTPDPWTRWMSANWTLYEATRQEPRPFQLLGYSQPWRKNFIYQTFVDDQTITQVQVYSRDVNFVTFDLDGSPINATRHGNYLGYKPRVILTRGRSEETFELLTKHEYGHTTQVFSHERDGARREHDKRLEFDDVYLRIRSNQPSDLVYIRYRSQVGERTGERGAEEERAIVYVDRLDRAAFYPFSLSRFVAEYQRPYLLSDEIREVQSIDAAFGAGVFGVVIVGTDESGDGVFFTTIDPQTLKRGVIRRLTPFGVQTTQRAHLRWTGGEWIVVWAEQEEGYKIARGQLECP